MCAAEVLVWGLKLWWIQERKKGFLEPSVLSRPDCAEGAECARQKDQTHAKECMYFLFFSPDDASYLQFCRIYQSTTSLVLQNLSNQNQNHPCLLLALFLLLLPSLTLSLHLHPNQYL